MLLCCNVPFSGARSSETLMLSRERSPDSYLGPARYMVRSVSMTTSPLCTRNPRPLQKFTMSSKLFRPRSHVTELLELAVKTLSGCAAGHQDKGDWKTQSKKSACQGIACCLLRSPAFSCVPSSRKGSTYGYRSRVKKLVSIPGKNGPPLQFSRAARVRPSGVMFVSGEGGPTQSLMKFPAAQFFITLYCVGVSAWLAQ